MAFRYSLKSGGIIEADTAGEIHELIALLKQEPQSGRQQSSVTLATDLVSEASSTLISATTVQRELQQTQQTQQTLLDLAPKASNIPIDENESDVISPISVPSVRDFCHLLYEVKRDAPREALRLLAERDNRKLTTQELEQHTGERCKGLMCGLGRTFHRITGLTWKDYFVLNNSRGVYEVNKTAHQNLRSAIEIVEPKSQN